MDYNVGFYCADTISNRGKVSDMHAFFSCIDRFVISKFSINNYSLIMDRFYKRYLRWEELCDALLQMYEIKRLFSVVKSATVDWKELDVDINNTCLQAKQEKLSDVFSNFFTSFDNLVEDAKFDMNKYGAYDQPLRIVIADIPEFYADEERPLEDYDKLEGEPFWMRKESIMEAFNVEEKINEDGGIIKTSWIRKKRK